jgi:hypothetical protein
VISITHLRESLVGDRVVFDPHGKPLELPVPDDVGPATMMVSEVTEALKSVDETGSVDASIDRDGMWQVDALVLGRAVLDRLEAGDHTVASLLQAVRDLGYAWQVSSTSAP